MKRYTPLIIPIILLIITFLLIVDDIIKKDINTMFISSIFFAIICVKLYNVLDELTDSNGNFYTPITDEQFKKECEEHLKINNMNNKQTIQSEIDKLKKQQLEQDKLIKELEQKLNEEEDWKEVIEDECEKINKYYYIASTPNNGLDIEPSSSNYDNGRPSQLKFYKKEHAELIKEKMLLMQEMYAYAHVLNSKYSHSPCYGLGYFGINLCVYTDIIKLKEEFKDRIEKYYFKQY